MKLPLNFLLSSLFIYYTYSSKLQAVQPKWRSFHSSTLIQDNKYWVLYGGIEEKVQLESEESIYDLLSQASNTLILFNFEDQEWYMPEISNVPEESQALFSIAGYSNQVFSYVPKRADQSRLQILDTVFWQWTFPSIDNSTPSPRLGHTLTAVGNQLYLYGGLALNDDGEVQAGTILNDMNVLNGSELLWDPLSNSLPRQFHSSCYLESLDSIMTYGGTDQNLVPFSSLQSFNLTRNGWDVTLPVGPLNPDDPIPAARMLHSAVCTNDSMIVFGGGSSPNSPVDSEVWILDSSYKWSQAPITNPDIGPSARLGHSSTIHDNKMYIFGGLGAEDDNNLYMLDLNEWTWSVIRPNKSRPTDRVPPEETDNNNRTVLIAALISGSFAIVAVGVIAAVGFRNFRRKKKISAEEEPEVLHNLPPGEKPSTHIRSLSDVPTVDTSASNYSLRELTGFSTHAIHRRRLIEESRVRTSFRNSIAYIPGISEHGEIPENLNSTSPQKDEEEPSSPTSVAPIRYIDAESSEQPTSQNRDSTSSTSSIPLANPITPPSRSVLQMRNEYSYDHEEDAKSLCSASSNDRS